MTSTFLKFQRIFSLTENNYFQIQCILTQSCEVQVLYGLCVALRPKEQHTSNCSKLTNISPGKSIHQKQRPPHCQIPVLRFPKRCKTIFGIAIQTCFRSLLCRWRFNCAGFASETSKNTPLDCELSALHFECNYYQVALRILTHKTLKTQSTDTDI